jgi:CPA2 family monovalent cation:H+ antiporter-2
MGPVGPRLFPWLFERGAAYLAAFIALSVALGAFVTGVVGEADLLPQVLGEVLPLRDVFAALIFVSVGMLVDPAFVVCGRRPAAGGPGGAPDRAGEGAAGGGARRRVPLPAAHRASDRGAPWAVRRVLLPAGPLGADLVAVVATAIGTMLAASAISIVLAAPLYGAALPAVRRLEPRLLDLSARLGRSAPPPSEAAAGPGGTPTGAAPAAWGGWWGRRCAVGASPCR